MVETHLANTVLTNGARFYVDHAHPEYSSPECLTPLECLVYDKAGEEVLRRAMVAAALRMPEQPAPVVYKNNSDGKGNSYGCHENYMMDRAVPFAKVIDGVVPHFVLAHALHRGRARSGRRRRRSTPRRVEYQISQRAEFFEEIVGLETTLKRPIVNTRDEPHADPKRFRRLHVIVGDANLSEIATFLKVGTTAIVLAMVEDDAGPTRDLSLSDPVRALHQVSADLSLVAPAGAHRRVHRHRARAPVGALRRGPQVRRGVRPDRRSATTARSGRWSWSTGRRCWAGSSPTRRRWPTRWTGWPSSELLLAYQERHSCGWKDPRVAALALQYHDLRPDKSRLPAPGHAHAGRAGRGGDAPSASRPGAPGPGSGASAWPAGPTPS